MTPQKLKAMKLALEALVTERDIYREHDEDGAPEYILDAITAIEEVLAEHAMQEVQKLGQEIEQAPVWIDAGNLKRLKKGDVLRVFRKGQEYYSAFRFDGLLQECDYTYDGDAPFVWLEVGMATLDKIVYTKKDFTTGAVYADRGDRVELFQPAIKEALAQPEQEPVAYPDGDVVGPCICGSWPGGKCLKCPRITTPPQRKPLTDEQMKKIWYAMQNIMGWYSFQEIARAIEAAHGIKENT